MEIKIGTKQILKFLYILSWIIFIGVCIEAGGFIFNTFYAMVLNPMGAENYWNGLDLSSLYNFDKGYFLVITFYMIIVAVLRALIFYLFIRLLHGKKLDLSHPFTIEFRNFISLVAYIALMIGLFSKMGMQYSAWLSTKGVTMPDLEYLRLGGPDVWFFMGVILLVISQIFKRGIEMQNDNELTI